MLMQIIDNYVVELLNLVVKNPELMPAAMNTIQKGWRYVKRLFKDFGIS